MKKKISFILVFVLVVLVFTSIFSHYGKIKALDDEKEVLIAEKLDWIGTPKCGWTWDGSLDVKKNINVSNGQAIVVNGVTYSANSIGTHLPATDVDQDIEYDISSYSTKYKYFDVLVGQPDNGNNALKFSILVDGVLKDTINWRQNFSDDLAYLRCEVSGATKITLRLNQNGYGYSDGTAVWVNPRLYNDDTVEKIWASDILDRVNNTTATGWDYGYGNNVMLDAFPNGKKLYFDDNTLQRFEKGLGVQLKGSTYEAYEADKTNQDNYVSLKWNIKDMNLKFFNALVAMNLSYGCHIDAYIDGVEAYKSGKIDSLGTLSATSQWIAFANKTVNVEIPENAETFELRVIPVNGIGDGLVGLCNAQFFKQSEYLYSWYGEEVYSEVWPYNLSRGYSWDGKTATVYDSTTQTSVTCEKSLYSIAGDGTNTMPSYTFDLGEENVNNYFSTKVGLCMEDSTASVTFCADIVYSDESVETYKSSVVTIQNSNVDFSFAFNPVGAIKIKLYIEAPSFAFSDSIWNAPKLEKKVLFKYIDGDNVEYEAYDNNEVATAKEANTQDGYEFLGWKIDGTENYFNFENAITEDKVLIADYKKVKFFITYYNMLDSVSQLAVYEPAFKTENQSVTLPKENSIDGYEFDGWYYNNVKITEFPNENVDIELVAKYKSIYFDVKFKNGDIETKDEVKWGTKVEKPTDPELENYTFDGWYKDEVKFDFNTLVKENIILNAKFEANTYDVNVYIDKEGSDPILSEDYSITHIYDKETSLPTANTLIGYTFDGWYFNNEKITKLEAKKYTSNITLSAKYVIATYTVNFDCDGSIISTQYVKYNNEANSVTAPAKEGYTFDNWYCGDTLFSFDSKITENKQIVAKYNINVYKVEFMYDDSVISTQNVKYNEKATVIDGPDKKGYTFAGWYNGETQYNFENSVTSDITLVAKYEKNKGNKIVIPVIASSSVVCLAVVALLILKKIKK